MGVSAMAACIAEVSEILKLHLGLHLSNRYVQSETAKLKDRGRTEA